MKRDNKSISFPGREQNPNDVVYAFDSPILKDIVVAGGDDWPRYDEYDQCHARGPIDYDHSSQRVDSESWLVRKTKIDTDNRLNDVYQIGEHREPEDPDYYGWVST